VRRRVQRTAPDSAFTCRWSRCSSAACTSDAPVSPTAGACTGCTLGTGTPAESAMLAAPSACRRASAPLRWHTSTRTHARTHRTARLGCPHAAPARMNVARLGRHGASAHAAARVRRALRQARMAPSRSLARTRARMHAALLPTPPSVRPHTYVTASSRSTMRARKLSFTLTSLAFSARRRCKRR
jgi:hypothetical protein